MRDAPIRGIAVMTRNQQFAKSANVFSFPLKYMDVKVAAANAAVEWPLGKL
jgi:hypothetical protein